jgi:hypothetical protein
MKKRISQKRKNTPKKYSKQELIRFVKMKAKELGRTPSLEEINRDKRLPCRSIYYKYFGSYKNALEKAGLKPKPIGYDCIQILELLKKKAKEIGRVPKMIEIDSDPNMPDTGVYRRCYGTFTTAVRKAGYTPFREYSNKEMLKLFKTKAKELGRSPTIIEIDNDPRLPSSALYFKRFGPLENIQRKLGIRPNVPRYSDDELIKMLKRKARQLGHPPTCRDIAEDKNLPCVSVYYTHFSTLQKVRELAGCPSLNIFQIYTNRELLTMLREKIKTLGRMPTGREINADRKMASRAVYSRRFGNWQNILKIMGFPPLKKYNKKGRYLTKTGEYDIPRILVHLQKKTKRLGRFPLRRELDKDPNIPSRGVLKKLFGDIQALAGLIGCTPPAKKPSYTDKELLQLLKMKADELGRAPTEEEVNKDKRLPTAYTYQRRFGCFINALDKIGMAPLFRSISKEELKKQILRFYKRYKKVPTRNEFEGSSEFPPLSIMRDKKFTWNWLLTECGLPIHSNKGTTYVNRKAELVVKKLLLASSYEVEDLTVKNYQSPFSFRINGKVKIHVSGSTWREAGSKYSYLVWGFHVPPKKEFDYMVGVGFDEKKKVEAIYVFPVDALQTRSIHTPANRSNRYSYFILEDFGQLSKALGI